MRNQITRPRVACLLASGLLVGVITARLTAAPQVPAAAATTQQIEFFEAKVRPLLVNSCYDCHADDEKGGLRLDSRNAVLKGGESGPAIVIGDPDGSLLMKAVRHAQGISKMPRSAPKLSGAEIAALGEWITMGAPLPPVLSPQSGTQRLPNPAARPEQGWRPTSMVETTVFVFGSSRYPLAPASVVDEYKSAEKKIKDKEKLLAEYMETEARQLAGTLALQAAKYMRAAWKVQGEPKEDVALVASREKLDYELFDRWVKFLAKPPKYYPYLTKWQAMVKAGGSDEEAKTLADEFQTVLLDVMFEAREIKEENDIIRAKALPGTKKKEPAHLSHEFVTNDDFCPGCGLELKSQTPERGNLWQDVFRSDIFDEFGAAPGQPIKPGLLAFRGWTLERWLGGDRRQYLDEMRKDIEALRKALPAKFAYVHGVKDIEKPVEQKLHIRGNPMREGDVAPRRFLPVLSAGDPVPLTRGSGRLDLAEAIVQQPIAMRVIVNRVWKWHFGSGIVDTPSNFGKLGELPTNPDVLEYLAQSFIDGGYSIN